ARELEAITPTLCTYSRTVATDRIATLRIADLLEPEAGGGAVEHAKQVVVVVLGCASPQLNYGSMRRKDTPPTTTDKVVARLHVGEGDRHRCLHRPASELHVVGPTEPSISHYSLKSSAVRKHGPPRP